MTKQEVAENILFGMREIENQLGLEGEKAEKALLEFFMQEFLIGDITRQDLNELASAMGYEIHISTNGQEVQTPDQIMA